MNERRLKKSDFAGQTSLTASDTFDFVRSGQNFKISFSDFLVALVACGTLEQKGEVTGIPILTTSGVNNYIKNLLNGAGITVSESPGGAALIAHNFNIDESGIPIIINPTTASPTVRSLVAGSGINVGAVNGNIQIAVTTAPASTKTVIVNLLTDFPTPATGVITLAANTEYYLTNDISSADRFVLQEGTILSGADGTLITLTYTGTGVMFTSVDASNKIKDLQTTCATGTLLSITGSGGDDIFQMINMGVPECNNIGTIDTMYVVSMENVFWYDIKTNGLQFAGNNAIISCTQNIVTLNSGIFINFDTSTFSGFNFGNSFGVMAAGTTLVSGAAGSANVNAGGLGSILNIRALGAGLALSGITTKDAQWQMNHNSGIPDSKTNILCTNSGGAAGITTVNVPVKITANWTLQEASRFEHLTGIFTYKGLGEHLHNSVTISATGGSVSSKTFNFYFYKNGIQVPASKVSRSFTTSAGSLSMLWAGDIETDDYLEIRVENEDDDTDLTINSIILAIE